MGSCKMMNDRAQYINGSITHTEEVGKGAAVADEIRKPALGKIAVSSVSSNTVEPIKN